MSMDSDNDGKVSREEFSGEHREMFDRLDAVGTALEKCGGRRGSRKCGTSTRPLGQ